MNKSDINFSSIPKTPGVYIFKGKRGKVLYVGKASNLRDRIRSYFSETLVRDRGRRLVDALSDSVKIDFKETENVFDAMVLEANLIKKYDPKYNIRERDNRSFPFIVITKEEFPRVIIKRGRELVKMKKDVKYSFGPFPQGSRDLLKVIRKSLPFRDKCAISGKKCFNAQIGLCPGVCSGSFSKREYAKRVREIKSLLDGKRLKVVKDLEKEMLVYAKKEDFEKAEEIRKRLMVLKHVDDVHLIKNEYVESGMRVEAYDVSHSSGENVVGVMVVLNNGELDSSEYRVFNIKKSKKRDDYGALRELLSRRFRHTEWRFPNLVVIDGGKAHINTAKKVFEDCGIKIPIVSVVKDERHRPKNILGEFERKYESHILKANNEAHRFSLSRQRRKRSIK